MNQLLAFFCQPYATYRWVSYLLFVCLLNLGCKSVERGARLAQNDHISIASKELLREVNKVILSGDDMQETSGETGEASPMQTIENLLKQGATLSETNEYQMNALDLVSSYYASHFKRLFELLLPLSTTSQKQHAFEQLLLTSRHPEARRGLYVFFNTKEVNPFVLRSASGEIGYLMVNLFVLLKGAPAEEHNHRRAIIDYLSNAINEHGKAFFDLSTTSKNQAFIMSIIQSNGYDDEFKIYLLRQLPYPLLHKLAIATSTSITQNIKEAFEELCQAKKGASPPTLRHLSLMQTRVLELHEQPGHLPQTIQKDMRKFRVFKAMDGH